MELNNVVHWIVGSDWLWLPVLAVSAMIIVAAMVVTGAATAAAFVVPYRSRTGRRAQVRQAPRSRSSSPPREPAREAARGPKGADVAPRSFGQAAWGGLPLGADAETRSA